MTTKKEVIDFLENKLQVEWYYPNDLEDTITVEAQSPNVEGYDGFVVDFIFDSNDNFVKLGIWE